MTRMEALEAVAEAAREMYEAIDRETSNPAYHRVYPAWGRIGDAIAALDALPADPAPARGEVVEAVMWEAKDGYIELSTPGSPASQRSSGWRRIGTTRLPLVKGDGA
jgi:hypothetical protein